MSSRKTRETREILEDASARVAKWPSWKRSYDAQAQLAKLSDPERLVRTCLNCGQPLVDRGCKLTCVCGYFASCSDYY